MFQKLQLFFLFSLLACSVFAQSPQNFNYQAALRDNADQVIANTAITARFTIKQGSINGVTVYQESQSLTTDDLGLLNASIGTGIVLVGSMNTIAWSQNAYYLKVEINTGGGFVDMGTAQLRSVPYAMHAASSEELTLPYADGISSLETAFFISNDGMGSAAEFHATEAPAVMVESNQTGISSFVSKNTPGDGYGFFSDITADVPGANAIGLYTSATGSVNSRGVLAFSDGAAFHGLGLGNGVGIMAVCETGNAAYLSTNSSNDYRPTLWLNEDEDDYARLRFSNYSSMDAWDVEAKYLEFGSDAEFKISMNGTKKLSIDESGNAGINVDNPAGTWHVHGPQYGIGQIRLTNNNTGFTFSDGLLIQMNDGECSIINNENSNLMLGTNNETLLTLYPSPNEEVSIGGNATLAVTEDFYGTANFQITNQIAGLGDGDGFKLEVNDLTTTMINRENAPLILGSNNDYQLHIYPSQYEDVTIGGNATLSVTETFYGTSNVQITNQIAGLLASDGLKMEVNDQTAIIINQENASLILGTNNQYNLIVGSNGKIGVNGSATNGGFEIRQSSVLAYNSGISFAEPGSMDYWAHGYGTGDDYDYYWNGALKAYVRDDNGAWTQGSDRSLKNSVEYISADVLNKVNQLKPCSYFYNNAVPGSPKSIGFIAQEVEEVFPELVYEKDGIKTLAYTDFAVLSVAAIKEQQKQIESLNAENEILKNQHIELNERLLKLEELLVKMMNDEK